jgi:hypothetical protein
MADRLAELLEAVDPHLRRRERVTPGDEADAILGVVGFLAKFVIASGETITGLKTTLTGMADASLSVWRFPANASRRL